MTSWEPIQYRGFYDFPRAVIVAYADRQWYLEAPFIEQEDEYQDHFDVFVLEEPLPDLEGSWEHLSRLGQKVGSVQAVDVAFDETRRRFIDASVLNRFIPTSE